MVKIEDFLKNRREQGLMRNLSPLSSRKNGIICINKKEYIDFSSNDYLGLSGHPKFIESAISAFDKYGTGSAASRLLSGDLEIHHILEEKIANFKNKESALIFNSGYQANVGIISSLFSKGDVIFSDRLNHASIIDGILLSGANFFRFKHNDLNHLESILRKERGKFNNSLIITETIFSMDGDKPDLNGLIELKEKYNSQIMVDEAHATGIYGKNGSGIVEEEDLSDKIDYIMGTFSKALGSFGAYFAASKKVTDYLINSCRSFIYSTALPPSVIACNISGIDLIKKEPFRRKNLLENVEFFRNKLEKRGFNVKGDSHIIPLIIGDNKRTMEFSKNLQEKGNWVLPIRPPTVPNGEARLRFSLTFHHDKKILQKLIADIPDLH
ncbi:MAG: 8-amino-7-oxononanoate synthase [Elusimicrobia bacterium RIFOXYD2_FULL_34_15]|nr:MAG: 8-amino-7-oxononanoate synthase [Elusimicrobia bacterium RIFOXYD2_FULL_34_15]